MTHADCKYRSPRMIRRGDALSGSFRFLTWSAVPLVVMSFVIWDAVVRCRHILQVTASYGVTVDAPAIDARSPTGYEHGLRSMVMPEAGEDTAHWVMQTQTMIAQREWRLRQVDYDNAPLGREVHWASPFHWWLAILAWADHLATGRPIGISVERAALIQGTVMFGLLLIGLVPLLSRRFSGAAAALFAIGAAATSTFYTDFLPGRADHHGLVNICSMLTVLLMAAGALRTAGIPANAGPAAVGQASNRATTDRRGRRSAQWWFTGSAVAGGVGLWISAATMIPVLIGLGLGVLAASWLRRGLTQRIAWVHDPGLFRLWGLVGGGVSLAAYLLEYFPSHLGLRLEVNHPFYAAAWIGAGEVLRLAVCAMNGGVKSLTRRELATGAFGAALVASLPLIIFATAAKTFTVVDPFLWELHTRYISEFQGLARVFATKGLTWSSVALVLPFFLLVPAIVMALRRATPPDVRAHLVLALSPAMVGWIQGCSQVRWLGLAYALSMPAVAVFFRSLKAQGEKKRTPVIAWSVACGLLFVPGAVNAVRQTLEGSEFSNAEIRRLAQRDVAHWLRQRAGNEPVVVASSPTGTTLLISQGGVSGLGTLYWENAEGLKHAAALFAAPSPEAAHELARRFGVTHFVFFSWDPFETVLAKLARGVSENALIPPDAFIAKLLTSPVPPPWLRAIPFKLPDHTALKGERIRIWEVTPDQTPAEAAAHSANYYLELGEPEMANRLAPILAGFKDDLVATVMLGGIASRQSDAAGFSAAFARIGAQLSQAESLSLDDHLHLVVVLAVGQRPDLAREQLQACMRKVNERSLRHLTADMLSDLFALSDGLGVEFSDPALKQLAERLVPPLARK